MSMKYTPEGSTQAAAALRLLMRRITFSAGEPGYAELIEEGARMREAGLTVYHPGREPVAIEAVRGAA